MTTNKDRSHQRRKVMDLLFVILLVIALAAGAYLRLVGVNWDENQHMHPDERFLSMVQVAISPVDNLSEYFDTAASSLNPVNRGYTFFVYGTLPVFIIRYLGEAIGQTDYHAITLLGRQVSALFDLTTVLLVFLIGRRLYDRWVGLLGALFYALAVLPIQLSHYMTVDTATNTFAFLAVFGAAWALTRHETIHSLDLTATNHVESEGSEPADQEENQHREVINQAFTILKELAPYILFGIALGAATASKINAVVLAIILPLVEWIRYSRLDENGRNQVIPQIIRNLVVAGIISFLTFRIGQPYAFNGPGFFNFGINEHWWASMQSLRSQASGAVDFPPALQWARRPITFSWQNLVAWGFGWPLGLAAWAAYFGMGILILRKKNWQVHLPVWLFTGLYFAWQSFSWVRTMRYQVLIYPALALIAAWGLVRLCTVQQPIRLGSLKIGSGLISRFGIVLMSLVILGTAAWAFAFSRIYTRPHTRVASSRWIYQNLPGPLTLDIETPEGVFRQPLPYRAGDSFEGWEDFALPFIAESDGVVTQITFPYMLDQSQLEGFKRVDLVVVSASDDETPLASAWVESQFLPLENEWRGDAYVFLLDRPLQVAEGDLYYIKMSLSPEDAVVLLHGSPSLVYVVNDEMTFTSPLPRLMQSIRTGSPFSMNVQVLESGVLTAVEVPFLVDQSGSPGSKDLVISLQTTHQDGDVRTARIESEFQPEPDVRGSSFRFIVDPPLPVESGQTLSVSLLTETEGARLSPQALAPVQESSWDDAIPYPVDGFSPYSETGGIYRPDLNFEMYWADDPSKLERFEKNLDLADYIFITSNRQWGTTTRVPERYPLTTHYYRNLVGCPLNEEVKWCYQVAEPGMFDGRLGFELVQVFQSYPNLGPFEINTQFAEEAFTVYDHPKVMIFRKTADYDPIAVREILRSVDLTEVVYFTPGEAARYQGPRHDQALEPRDRLMLPEDRLAEQRAGGTWSELFDRESLLNTSQVFAAAVFYLFITLLGLLCYPLVRLGMPGLADRGFPFSKLAGLLLLALIVWLLGSMGAAVTSNLILVVLGGIDLLSLGLIIIQRQALWQEVRTNWRYYLTVEMLALVAFVFFLLIRLGNPDLWHPFKGGEKPMDFSYLNAVIKSTTFPPYDPWFAGGFINYYYYGFVIAGIPIKLLGIIPSVAYNIVLAVWYSIFIVGGFSVGWNLFQGFTRTQTLRSAEDKQQNQLAKAFWAGLAAAIGLGLLGNLGTVMLVINGFQRIASGGIPIDQATIGQQIGWAIQGFGQFIQGTPLPFYPGDWYWVPSRVIPGNVITEFPYFTFIYADLHAHLLAFPITVFVIGWSLSIILNKAKWGESDGRYRWLSAVIGIFIGGMAIGSLRATNTWDYYTYLVLGVIALAYSIIRHYSPRINLKIKGGVLVERLAAALIAGIILILVSMLLYRPFDYWYGQAYTEVAVWEGDRTPLISYLTHWGLFLFVIASWMAWETYHWMKTTPQSALKKLEPYHSWILAAIILIIVLLGALLLLGVVAALLILPLGLWAVILMLKPDRTDGGRFHLFMIGSALTLTLVVEVVHLVGDIGRMNTVFKFYLQSWVLFALSAGVCLVWIFMSLKFWRRRIAYVWQILLILIVGGGVMFTVMGTADKIRDRMAPEAPLSLDGMAFMPHATYFDSGEQMQLVEDFHAIQWMQDHVVGSPVIVEGQAYEYRWGNRYTIYTGLPGVIGWNWHQRQQRAVLQSNIVQERVNAVNDFYKTDNIDDAVNFLEEHDVAYIVVGQLERIYYPDSGLNKFEQYEGELWEAVFQYGSTMIYEVLD